MDTVSGNVSTSIFALLVCPSDRQECVCVCVWFSHILYILIYISYIYIYILRIFVCKFPAWTWILILRDIGKDKLIFRVVLTEVQIFQYYLDRSVQLATLLVLSVAALHEYAQLTYHRIADKLIVTQLFDCIFIEVRRWLHGNLPTAMITRCASYPLCTW